MNKTSLQHITVNLTFLISFCLDSKSYVLHGIASKPRMSAFAN